MLDRIQKGRMKQSLRLLVFGQPGVGKSTFASQAPSPLFLGQDAGTGHLDVARFPEPTTWAEVMTAVKEYASTPHEYKTLVLDPIGWVEPLAYAHLCQAHGWPDIEHPGYGKGYVAALGLWRTLLVELERAWKQGHHIVLVAHACIRTFHNPAGDDFDRYVPLMNDKLSSLLQGWADAVLFACHDVVVSKEHKGMLRGPRVLKTTYAPAYDAKNRWQLPETVPLAWSSLDEDPASVIETLLEKQPLHAPKVRKAMNGATKERLRQILGELQRCT